MINTYSETVCIIHLYLACHFQMIIYHLLFIISCMAKLCDLLVVVYVNSILLRDPLQNYECTELVDETGFLENTMLRSWPDHMILL